MSDQSSGQSKDGLRIAGRDIFLVGAGFSRALNPQMPLMLDLSSLLLVDSPWKQVGNFEEVLTYLSERAPWEEQAVSLRKRADFLDLSREIGRTIKRIEESHKTFTDSANQLAAILHANQTPVLSLNYDTLIEKLFAQFKIPTGKLFPVALTNSLSRDGTALLGGDEHRTIKLFKLHGSTSWYYSGGEQFFGETIYHLPIWPNRHPSVAGDAVSDKIPLIVPPTLHKSSFFKNETIEALWRMAGVQLFAASRLIVIGYSLPPTDSLMTFFLRTMGKNIRTIILVDPSEAPLENFKGAVIGKSVIDETGPTFKYVGGPNAFDDFVNQYRAEAF